MLLITGTTGFIGKNLVRNLSCDYRSVLRIKKDSFLQQTDKSFYLNELSSRTNWDGAFQDIDCVIHLAGMAHRNYNSSSFNINILNEVNIAGTLKLAQSAAQNGVKRFIFISSVGVNGISSKKPFTEQDNPNPKDLYASTKLVAEESLIKISKKYGMEFVIIRPPLVYGVGAPGNFDRLCKLLVSKCPLPLGSLTNKRSFINVTNLVDFILLCTIHPNAANERFLISDDNDLSTSEFLKSILLSLKRKKIIFPFPFFLLKAIALLFRKSHELDKLHATLQIDPSKAKKLLGWYPKINIAEGLKGLSNEY